MFARKLKLTLICAILSVAVASPAHALDKRLKLMFKTAAYGAGAGLLVGGAVAAMGVGSAQNLFMGASSGMYAGILLAAYIVATPPERDPSNPPNPYAPKRPTDSRDWKDGEWDEDEYKNDKPYSPDNTMRDPILREPVAHTPQRLVVWMPIASLSF